MKVLRIVFVVLMAVVFTASGVLAQGHTGHSAKDDPKKACNEHFDMMDTNHDGFVTLDEYKAMGHGGNAEKTFKKMDTNGDGKVSREEMCGK